MMEDTFLSKIYDFENSGELFVGQHIDGGICYFLWDRNSPKTTLDYFYKPENSPQFKTNRRLSDGGSDIVIRDYRRQSIIGKMKSLKSFSEIVSARKPFGINTDLFNNKDGYPQFGLNENQFLNSVKVWGVYGIKGGAKRISSYMKIESVPKRKEWIGKYKLLISKAFSANSINPPEFIEAGPQVICTETFLVIGPFDSEFELRYCHQFTKSNFFKILLYFGRGTMQVSQDVFRFIPLENFTDKSDIDWDKSIQEIDRQLYTKYKLSNEEINFMESLIKPMS